MNAFALSGLMIGISCLTMAVWIFTQKGANAINLHWSGFCICVGIWGFGGFAIGAAGDAETSLLCWRLAYVGVILIPGVFYHFVVRFLGLSRPGMLWVVYGITAVFFGLNWSEWFMPVTTWMFDEMYFLAPPGPLYPFFVAFFYGLVLYSHVEMWKFMRGSRDVKKRAQIQWFFLATSIGFTGGATCFWPSLGFEVYPYGNFAVVLYPPIMTYAILRHNLMDIRIVLKKSLVYSLVSALVSVFYVGIISSFPLLFYKGDDTGLNVVVVFLSIMLVAVLLKPAEVLVNRIVDKKFFKGSLSEIAEQKEILETELERSQRLKSVGILAAGMAHEIKNPLTALRTFAEYLPEKYNDPEFREKFSEVTLKETDRIQQLLADLLLFSKPSEPKKVDVQLKALLEDVIHLLRSELEKCKVKLALSIEPCELCADPSQLKQAVLNIILNAIDAMRDGGGELCIECTCESGSVEISIVDSGSGISQDILPYIFDPFHTTKDEGTGLGLAITHSMIQKNGGSITVRSREGKGAEFLIKFPITS